MKLRIFTTLLLILFPVFLSANTDLGILQKQGFETFTSLKNGSKFSCKNQCIIVLGTLETNEFLELKGKLSGKGVIGYGFINGNQILAGGIENIDGDSEASIKFNFSATPFYSQLPKEIPIVLIVNGTVSGDGFLVHLGQYSPVTRFIENFKSASRYVPFSPRTINFLEGPMWGGEYINKAFFSTIVFLLAIALLWSIFEKEHQGRQKKSILFGFFVIVFFWVFFDAFSSMNQIKMYKDFSSAPDFMANGRLAKNGDFYQYLDFVKEKVPSGAKGNFIVPYPFDGEGKYHAYPYIRFQNPEDLEYVFTYNPYGKEAPFGFVDPVYDESLKSLTWNPSENRSYRWDIQTVLSFGSIGKIYVIKK